MLKKRTLKLLFELIKNSKRSDREIAKIIGVSQPTITRMRQKLEKRSIIEYTVIPNWQELGFEMLGFTFIQTSNLPEFTKKAGEWADKTPNVVFAGWGKGMGMDCVMISLHNNYTNFSEFIISLKSNTLLDTF